MDHLVHYGELWADWQLTVSVRGLVLGPAEPVPDNLQGTNPAPTFHAVVSCQSVDDSGLAPMMVCASTRSPPPRLPATHGTGSTGASIGIGQPARIHPGKWRYSTDKPAFVRKGR